MFYSSPEIFVEPPTGSNNNNHDENYVSDSEDHESEQIKDRKSVFIAYAKMRRKLETSDGGAGLGEGEIAVDVILLGNRPGNDFTHLLELLPKPPDRYAFTIYHILIELLVSTGGPALFFALWRVSELIANSGIAPETRREFSSVSDPFAGKLYIHGGVHDVSIPTVKYFKDFFILHGDDLSWSPIGTTGINMPPSRIDHAAVLIAMDWSFLLVIVCGPNIDPCIGHTAVYDTLKSHFLIKIDSYGDVAMYPNLDFRLNPSPEIVSIRVVKVEDEGGLGLKCGKR
ncbi:16271_t:CDS:2 [Entrophospora sp. SA101]|nr:6045_t:CDS:2 [Entrophospora sp. SA101]CAJ0634555.1 16271_t:CDS:2 [Entrophospora sp. SA101]